MSSKICIKKLSTIDLLTALMVISSVALRNYQYLLYGIQGIYLLYSLVNIRYMDFKFFFVRGFFVMWVIASMLWATSQSSAIGVLPSVIQIFILCFALTSYFYSYDKLESFITIIIIASVVLTINLLLSTSAAEWREIIYFSDTEYINAATDKGRIGPTVELHPNAFAATITVSIICCFYRLYNNKDKKYLLWMLVLVVLLFLAKSRSSMIEAIIGIMIIWIIQQKKITKQFRTFIMAGLIFAVFLWASVNVTFLYNLFGYRMEGFLTMFTDSSGADSSSLGRLEFIQIALGMFMDSPVLGVGMNNFSYIAFREYGIWAEVSSHNNYAEILADLGIIGFIAYYSLFVTTFFKLKFLTSQFKKYNKDEVKIANLLFAFIIVFFVMEFFHISYDKEIIQFTNLFVFSGAEVLMIRYNKMKKLKQLF